MRHLLFSACLLASLCSLAPAWAGESESEPAVAAAPGSPPQQPGAEGAPQAAPAAPSEPGAAGAAPAAPVSRAPLFVAGAMILTFALRRFAPKIPSRFLPWVAVVLAVLGRIIAAKGQVDVSLLLSGLGEGLAAGGLYSAAGRYVLRPARRVDEAARSASGGGGGGA